MEDPRRYSAAAERNGPPILAQLQRVLPPQGLLLEIASGTGQHAAFCSAGLAGWQWQPTDRDDSGFASIAAWSAGLPQVQPALTLDVLSPIWPGVPAEVDAIFCANLLHIAPWSCTPALMQGAARHLAPGGLLITYGPYLENELEDGVPTAPGNTAFDADLRSRNPAWGLRRLADVAAQAQAAGLALRERVALPANNLLLVWGRLPDDGCTA
jgi:SAM-dependent methyltransferase